MQINMHDMQNNMQNNSATSIFCIFCILQYAEYVEYAMTWFTAYSAYYCIFLDTSLLKIDVMPSELVQIQKISLLQLLAGESIPSSSCNDDQVNSLACRSETPSI